MTKFGARSSSWFAWLLMSAVTMTSCGKGSAVLVTINISPAQSAVTAGEAQQFKATGTYSDWSIRDISTSVTWSSSNSAVASISNAASSAGLATTLAPGPATISASLGDRSASASLTVTRTQFAYVTNTYDNSISQYEIGADHSLMPLAVPTIGTGVGANYIVIDPSGRFAYVVAYSIYQYSIGQDGELTALSEPTVKLSGNSALQMSIDPSGRFAYVLVRVPPLSIAQFAIGKTGALSPLSPSGIAVKGYGPKYVAIDPAGHYAYVSSYDGIEWHAIAANRTLGPALGLTGAANGASFITFDPSGRYAYAACNYSFVCEYTVGSNGALTPKTPGQVEAGAGAFAIGIDPRGQYAYVGDSAASRIAQFSIVSGALEPLSPTFLTTGSEPFSIALDRTGHYVYVANDSSNTISQYTIGMNGTLTPITPATVATGHYASSIAVTP